jgi:ribokinase
MTRTIEWDVVVVGGVSTDYLVKGQKLPTPGESLQGDLFLEVAGGNGANKAVAVARLGVRVALVARVGTDDRGKALVKHLQAEGVDTRYIIYDPDTPTGATVIQINEQAEKQMLSAPGANQRLTVMDIQAASEAIAATRVLLTQLDVPIDTLTTAVALAHEAGVQVILDPAPVNELPDGLLPKVSVLKLKTEEAEMLTGVQVHDRDSARQAAQHLLKRGVGAVAIQAGEEGNLLIWHDGEYWLPEVPCGTIDATGAGDAFGAAMAVAIAEDRTLPEAGFFANTAAALTTMKLGAQVALPQRDAVEALQLSLKTVQL